MAMVSGSWCRPVIEHPAKHPAFVRLAGRLAPAPHLDATCSGELPEGRLGGALLNARTIPRRG